MLHPHTVIVYDELEASEAVRWEWLLHSPTEFKMDATKKTLSTNNKIKGWMAVTQLWRTCFYAVPNGPFRSAARHHRSGVS